MTATQTADELFAGCLSNPGCKAGWLVLTDYLLEAVDAAHTVTASADGRVLKVQRWWGTAVLMVTVDGSGAALRQKDLPKWLPRVSKPR